MSVQLIMSPTVNIALIVLMSHLKSRTNSWSEFMLLAVQKIPGFSCLKIGF